MNTEHRPLLALPDDLPAEAAARLIALLHDAARILEHYYAPTPRHDDRQQPLWPEDGPPF